VPTKMATMEVRRRGSKRTRHGSRPTDEFVALYGANGERRDLDRWTAWLLRAQRDDGEAALSSVAELQRQGCSERFLLQMMMEAHATLQWSPAKRADVLRARRLTDELINALRPLAQSRLREELGLIPVDPSGDEVWTEPVLGMLATLHANLTGAARHATERKNPLFDNVVGQLVIYVRQQTNRLQDEHVDRMIAAILTEPFSTRDWRKRHKPLWTVPFAPTGPPVRQHVLRVDRRVREGRKRRRTKHRR
jgi:hypothetical protein